MPSTSDGRQDTTHDSRSRVGGWLGGLALFLLSTLLCLGLAELATRAFWRLRFDVPFRRPLRVLYAYYPELQGVDHVRPRHDDKFFDILLLGASTLHVDWGDIDKALEEQLASHGRHNVRIFNLARPAQSSRDSRLKYAALGADRFDLVVVYDGINDARANNVPPELFHEDYRHYSWYEMLNALAPYHGSSSYTLPYTLRWLSIRFRNLADRDQYVPVAKPRRDWVQYGRDHRSVESFRHNLEAILDLASQRGDPVLLMTFATYVPANYSLEAFKEKRLDYGLHLLPIERWGRREDVVETVALQNEVVRNLAARHKGTLLVDQAQLMPRSASYFNDPCHLTVLGSEKFAENMLPTVLQAIQSRSPVSARRRDSP